MVFGEKLQQGGQEDWEVLVEEGRYFFEGIDRVVINVLDVEDFRVWDEENDGGGVRMGQIWRVSIIFGVFE